MSVAVKMGVETALGLGRFTRAEPAVFQEKAGGAMYLEPKDILSPRIDK